MRPGGHLFLRHHRDVAAQFQKSFEYDVFGSVVRAGYGGAVRLIANVRVRG